MAILSIGCFGPVKPGVRLQKRTHKRDRLDVSLDELLPVAAAVPSAVCALVGYLVRLKVHESVSKIGPLVSIELPNNALHFTPPSSAQVSAASLRLFHAFTDGEPLPHSRQATCIHGSRSDDGAPM
jgi:hypothetical protein